MWIKQTIPGNIPISVYSLRFLDEAVLVLTHNTEVCGFTAALLTLEYTINSHLLLLKNHAYKQSINACFILANIKDLSKSWNRWDSSNAL